MYGVRRSTVSSAMLGCLFGSCLLVPTLSGTRADPGAQPAAAAGPALEDSLIKARCNGKYVMLLRQFKVEKDRAMYNDFQDLGERDMREYGGESNLPKGYWVYVYPYWYIWRDLTSKTKPRRSWGPEQVVGEPDAPESGDSVNAWASLTADGQEEWLLLEYGQFILPRSVHVYENYAPGALSRITVFRLDGTEVEVWKGKDPTSPDEDHGVSVVPIKIDFKINRIKIYLDSQNVPNWNEVDAVGLRDADGKMHWVTACDASTTYAQQMQYQPFVMVDNNLVERLTRLETDVKELKELMKEIKEMVKDLKKKDSPR